jgi:pimeloyl-ACP methyl ester carboxylesterase
MTAAPTRLPVPEGPGSVFQAPGLPEGFANTFTSRYVDIGELRLHAVTGGDGPPLLLVHGWPQTWYQFRMLMPALAQDFQVIAVDQRGAGLSDKPLDGYDTGTLARDLVALMEALGHRRFAMFGCDTGLPIGYALAADHPDRLDRLAVAEAPLPGVAPSPPLCGPKKANDRLWHLTFNRLDELNEQLVKGREDVYFGWQFASKAGHKLPDEAVDYYVQTLANDPEALHGSFAWYRALEMTAAQNEKRKSQKLTLPILAIGGAESLGDQVGKAFQLAADNVQSKVIPGTGHWVSEEAPEDVLGALLAFLAPYRDSWVAAHR